ncbi:site-specific integrase [uncultured Marinobacter sp.]|uniref:tyrosine-type recombinase/integrase n=1 Tax=uncultured Marinobacter sp. TaxID=187379 RepID=UPI00258379D8|nr:site-specific integrase [uncultured Marinobacter sp.]
MAHARRRHVTLRETTDKGRHSWVLIDPEGEPIIGFTLYMRFLAKKNRRLNTRKGYARALSQFFDYLYEVANLYNGLSEELLEEACEAYEAYMVLGERADDELAREVAQSLPSPKLQPSSYTVHHSALNGFLRQSGRFANKIKQLQSAGYGTEYRQREELLHLSKSRTLSNSERNAMLKNSVFASTVAGGARSIQERMLDRRFPAQASGAEDLFDNDSDEKTFPWDRFQELLDAAPSHRERAFWSLQAATGCRYSEALQILWQDIRLDQREVKIVDPRCRIGVYETCTPDQLEELVFKARATRSTFMINPWAQRFFQYLLEYMRSEDYRRAVQHDFVFQSKGEDTYGAPYRFNSYQGMLTILKRTIKKVLGTDRGYGFHSFRHMYGFYLANYALRADGGMGLPLPAIQAYMGHADIKTTRKYARSDKELLKLQLGFANRAVMGVVGPKTLLELQIQKNEEERYLLLQKRKALPAAVDGDATKDD